MNKTVVKRLKKLASDVQTYEEALERRVSPKTIGIVKHRVGLEGGRPHTIHETAVFFGVSTTWVGKATLQVKNLIKELSNNANAESMQLAEKDRQRLDQLIEQNRNQTAAVIELSQTAKQLDTQATNRAILSFLLMLVTLVSAATLMMMQAELDERRFSVAVVVVTIVGALAVYHYVRGVSCMSQRNGILHTLRKIG